MIANALDSDGIFTAAQVSRKLKQVGLRVRRQKSSEANMHLRDEEFNDYSTDVAQNSDDETLLSLRHRNKDKRDNRLSSEEALKQRIDGKLLEDDSDDQLLVLFWSRKKRRCLPMTKNEKLATASFQQSVIENDRNWSYSRRYKKATTALKDNLSCTSSSWKGTSSFCSTYGRVL